MENKKEFKTHNAHYGNFGGGTQPPVYLDSKTGKPKPYNKTKWFAKVIKDKVISLAKGVKHEL